MQTIQGTTLNCYVDESRTVWYCEGSGKTQRSTEKPEHFVSKLTDVEEVRVVGFANNAELLVRLYQLREQTGHPLKIKVVSPAFFQGVKSDPGRILTGMRDNIGCLTMYPPNFGGWHDLTDYDFQMYSLVSAVRQEKKLTPTIEDLLHLHPAWPAISFVGSGDMFAAAKTLATIVDPRWYIDVNHPSRGSRLKVFLGLTQSNIRHVYYGQGAPGFHWQRCMNVVRAWCVPPSVPAVSNGEPSDFIRRCCARHRPLTKGILRASNLYLTFVKAVWLDSMSVQSLFAPDHFFEGDDPEYRELTVKAWLVHAD